MFSKILAFFGGIVVEKCGLTFFKIFLNNQNLQEMKKTLLILAALTITYSLMAQEAEKQKQRQKEVGLVFTNLNNFGLTYRTGTAKSLWRINTLVLNGNDMNESSEFIARKNSYMQVGGAIGREYRQIIADNLELRFGSDLGFTYAKSKSVVKNKTEEIIERQVAEDERTTYSPSINLVFGFNYIIKSNFLLAQNFHLILPTLLALQ